MPDNSKFDVYTGKFVPAIGVPVVLITGEKVSDILYSEYHIFLQDQKNNVYYSRMYTCPAFNIHDILNFDIDYMLNIALEAAQGEIINHIFNKFKDSNTLYDFDYDGVLKKSTPGSLMQLYIENKFRKEIENLRNNSLSKALRGYLITVLPVLINIDFYSEKTSDKWVIF